MINSFALMYSQNILHIVERIQGGLSPKIWLMRVIKDICFVHLFGPPTPPCTAPVCDLFMSLNGIWWGGKSVFVCGAIENCSKLCALNFKMWKCENGIREVFIKVYIHNAFQEKGYKHRRNRNSVMIVFCPRKKSKKGSRYLRAVKTILKRC